ncbi:MAG: hypothetical protein OHK0029_26670 [Armatimonadaceae bacterium]
MESSVKATLGERLDVAVTDQEEECCLLVSGEELGGDKGNTENPTDFLES